MKYVLGNSGNTLIETLVSISVATTALMLLLSTFYVTLARSWLDFVVYESLICMVEQQSTSTCKSQASQRIDYVLPLGETKKLVLKRDQSSAHTSLLWQMTIGNKKWKIEKNESLSLDMLVTAVASQ